MKQDTFSKQDIDIVVPDLGPGSESIRFVMWLVPVGAKIISGERLAEICTQGIVLHLEAEHEGTLQQQFVQAGAQLQPGDALGTLRPAE